MEPDTTNKRSRRAIKWTLTFVGALIVGALGNGLWEYIIRDSFAWVGRKTIELISWAWGGYLDSLYATLGSQFGDALMVPPFLLASMLLTFAPVLIAMFFYKDSRRIERDWIRRQNRSVQPLEHTLQELTRLTARIETNIKRLRILARFILPPMTVALFAYNFVLVAQTMYVRNAANWLNRSSEILAPRLEGKEFLQLRADIRAIDSTNSFTAVNEKIRALAVDRKVTLPPFSAVGVPPKRNP